jgi:hypothetical protein
MANNSKVPASRAEKKAGTGSRISTNANPVAHEVQVIVAGARPGEVGGKRELFTEETSTVLVFEFGGVLRLTAAVAAGQLLFLTNKETKREVVAQVALKRDFKPMNCFVEVEFSEPAPGFWGIAFPEAPQEYVLLNPQQAKLTELVQAAKPVADKPSTPAHTHSAQEVEALKQQVEALREQLKSLQSQAVTKRSSAPDSAADPKQATSPISALVRDLPDASIKPPQKPPSAVGQRPPTPAATAKERFQEVSRKADGTLPQSSTAAGQDSPRVPRPAPTLPASVAADSPLDSSSLPVDRAGQTNSEGNLLPKPSLDFSQARPTAKRASKSRQKVAASGRTGMLRKGLFFAALLLVAAGVAWYENLIPGLPQPKKVSAGVPASVALRPAPAARVAPEKPAGAPHDSPASKAASGAPASPPSATLPATTLPGTAIQVAPQTALAENAKHTETTPSDVPVDDDAALPAWRGKSAVVASAEKHDARRALSNAALGSAARPSDGAAIVPPKLIKSVLAVAAPEALQDFATGDVKLEALVDSSGHVKSMKALSGPASLRRAAMDALNQYRYEPATLRGKPVAARVIVTIKFLFEP